MTTRIEKIREEKFLIISLIAIAAANTIANYLGEEVGILEGNLAYPPITIGVIAVSVAILRHSGTTGKHGSAWVALLGYAICSFFAEITWNYYELVIHVDPFPSLADIFYLLAYPFLLMFLISYIDPVKKAITKKMVVAAIAISLAILYVSLTILFEEPEDSLDFIFGLAYPFADAIVIVPALIGIGLFFRGEVNFMMSLVFLGILCTFIADTAFLFAQMEDTYYTGHPMEILWHWGYVLIAFGVNSHRKLFQVEKTGSSGKDDKTSFGV